jgi:hypothetical protein
LSLNKTIPFLYNEFNLIQFTGQIISFFLACASAQWVAPYSNWSPYNPSFYNDLVSKSVDLNKDGQPDAPFYTAAPAVYPNYYPYAGLNYRGAFPGYTYGSPFTYPFTQAATAVVANASPAAVQKTSIRAKRQVPVLPHKPSEFHNDFAYSSVDLNQDGQPDNLPVYTAPVAPWTGARFVAPYTTPFTGYNGYYPQTYPFVNGFLG